MKDIPIIDIIPNIIDDKLVVYLMCDSIDESLYLHSILLESNPIFKIAREFGGQYIIEIDTKDKKEAFIGMTSNTDRADNRFALLKQQPNCFACCYFDKNDIPQEVGRIQAVSFFSEN